MTPSLYERLGKADGIGRLVDDVMAAHLVNPIVKPRFAAIADLDRAKRLAHEFFCVGAGGPESYTGRDMLAAHRGMNISEEEYLAVVDDIMGALAKNDIDAPTRTEVLGILYSLKGTIVRV